MLAQVLQGSGDTDGAARARDEYQKTLYVKTRLTELNALAIAEPANLAVREELATLFEQMGNSAMASVWHKAADHIRSQSQK